MLSNLPSTGKAAKMVGFVNKFATVISFISRFIKVEN